MKRTIHSILVVIASLFITATYISCGKDDPSSNPNDNNPANIFDTSQRIEGSIEGRVLDREGNAISFALVQFENQTAESDLNGYFKINADLPVGLTFVTISKENYFDAYATVVPPSSGEVYFEITLNLLNKTKLIDNAFLGGSWSLEFQENSFAYPNGEGYSGDVYFSVNYINPKDPDFLKLWSGSLVALDMNGDDYLLNSFGMMDVLLWDENDNPLEINKSATITMQVPDGMENVAPNEIPLWHFDTQTGIWKEESTATLIGDQYVGTVDHFSFWNCDVPVGYIWIEFCFLTEGNLAGHYVSIFSENLNMSAGGILDQNNSVSGYVPDNEELLLTVRTACGNYTIYSELIGPFLEDTKITRDLNSIEQKMLVTGILLDCNADPVENGIVLIQSSCNYESLVKTDSNGEFKFQFENPFPELKLHAVDLETGFGSNIMNYPYIDQDIYELGTIVACDQVVETKLIVTNNDGVYIEENATVNLDSIDNDMLILEFIIEGKTRQVKITNLNLEDGVVDPTERIYISSHLGVDGSSFTDYAFSADFLISDANISFTNNDTSLLMFIGDTGTYSTYRYNGDQVLGLGFGDLNTIQLTIIK